MIALFTWFACHFLGDFPLQGDYLAKMKATSWQHLVYHCACYTGVFVLFARPSLPAIATLFMTHLVIDGVKSRNPWFPLWLDQALHLGVIVALLA